ncbi:MAG: imidazole glycerol phosphate synthase subunit HisH, partial [Chloroflexi bacterium]|nr:imidazole glycerol phosphate synthase subunit HisH [Chloroflexota bacterium]
MAVDVILIDAGTGNLRSVHKALEAVGARVTRTADPDVVRKGARLVLPGVGAFGDFMAGMRQQGLEEAVLEAVGRGAPLLGICVGMQALFEVGEEMGEHRGLGLLPGRVVAFPAGVREQGLKIPHTGWNFVRWVRKNPLMAGLEDGGYAYFNHSFYCAP